MDSSTQPLSPDSKQATKKKYMIYGGIALGLILIVIVGVLAYPSLTGDKKSDNKNANNTKTTSTPTATPTNSYVNPYGNKISDALAKIYSQGDVLTNQTFTCDARSDDEWYRTDHTLVVDPKNPNIMYINVEYRGIYKSIDGGKTWTQKVKGLKVYANEKDKTKGCYSEYPVIAIDPNDSNHLLLGVSGGGGGFLDATTPNSQVGGAYQSFDAGETWELMINDKMNVYLNDIVFDKNSNVYYGTSSNPASWIGSDQNSKYVTKGLVYKTTDDGKTWTELPTGIGNRTSASSVLINDKNPDEILITTFSAGRPPGEGEAKDYSTVTQLGILRSIDGGKTWAEHSKLPGNPAILMGVASKNNFNYIYTLPSGQLNPKSYISTDAGKTFKETNMLVTVAYDPYDPTGKHAIGYSVLEIGPASQNLTLWETKDGGVTWNKYGKVPKEITSVAAKKTKISKILWHPTESKTLFMSGAGGRVYKSKDLGMTWEMILSYEGLK